MQERAPGIKHHSAEHNVKIGLSLTKTLSSQSQKDRRTAENLRRWRTPGYKERINFKPFKGPHLEETIQKMKKTHIGHKTSERTRKKISQANERRWKEDKDYRARMSQPQTEVFKKKRGEAIAQKWKDKEHRKKRLRGRGIWNYATENDLIPIAVNHNFLTQEEISALRNFYHANKKGRAPDHLMPSLVKLKTAVISLPTNS